MKKTLLAILLIMVCYSHGCSDKDATLENEAVAIVNGTEISAEEFTLFLEQYKTAYSQLGIDFETEEGKEMLKQLETEIINNLIDHQVVLQAAEKDGYTADEEEVEKILTEFKEQFASEEEMLESLEAQNVTLDDLREDISRSLVYNNYIQDQIGMVEVTEEELEEAYQAHEEETGEEVDEEMKQLISDQLQWQKEEELRLELVENLKKESDIEILL